jgi:hypothetical protein
MTTYSAVPADNPDEIHNSNPPSYEASQAEYESSRLIESTNDDDSERDRREETTSGERYENERTNDEHGKNGTNKSNGNTDANITDNSATTHPNTLSSTNSVSPCSPSSSGTATSSIPHASTHRSTFIPLIVVDTPSESIAEHSEQEGTVNKTPTCWNRNTLTAYYVIWFSINSYLLIAMILAIGYVRKGVRLWRKEGGKKKYVV